MEKAMKRVAMSAVAMGMMLTAGWAQEKAGAAKNVADTPRAAAELPIDRVVLYKNGVGYFEHRGRVVGSQELNIRFTTAQLNDVLKSLTVVDLGGGKVGGVRYNSIAPLSQRLSTLRLALDGNTDRASFLNALRGARVEVKSGASAAVGKLLSVEEVTRAAKDDREIKVTEISLVSDAGELRTFELTPATAVRILDGEMTREVGRYMTLLASARDKDVRQMTIATEGTGAREIVVSYISEVPVWKSTYRIVLPQNEKAKPLLQGWAVVDNTVGEDWKDVRLSLVAGAPQSFVQQISQPYYVRRPVVDLPKSAVLGPQTHEEADGKVALDQLESFAKVAEAPAPAPMMEMQNVPAARARRSLKAMRRRDEGGMPADANSLTDTAEASFAATAAGAALGDMFEYAIQQKVTVLQNQSALVPIVQARVEAEKVTIWNEKEKVPLRALWLTNSSGLTLDAGTFNIVEDGAFAGEGLLSEVHPDERRLLSYAGDTAVRVKAEGSYEEKPYTRIRAARGLLVLTRELRRKATYTVTNTDKSARNVVIEHPARAGWKFSDAALKPEESTNSYHRFRVKVEAKAAAKLEVAEYLPQETTYALTNLDENFIGMLLKTTEVQPEIEAGLRRLLAKKGEIAAVERALAGRRSEVESISREQARIRENMKALKGSSEEKALVERYVKGLNQQEDRLTALNGEIAEKERQKSGLEAELEKMAEGMVFEQGK